MDPTKATGPNSISHVVLNLVTLEISKILADLYNFSFAKGKFPDLLKQV